MLHRMRWKRRWNAERAALGVRRQFPMFRLSIIKPKITRREGKPEER